MINLNNKKPYLFGLIIILFCLLFTYFVVSQPPKHFLIVIKVFYNDTPINNANIVIRNLDTNEKLTGKTSEFGEFIGNLANLPKGYTKEQEISINVCIFESSCKEIIKKMNEYNGGATIPFRFDLINKPRPYGSGTYGEGKYGVDEEIIVAQVEEESIPTADNSKISEIKDKLNKADIGDKVKVIYINNTPQFIYQNNTQNVNIINQIKNYFINQNIFNIPIKIVFSIAVFSIALIAIKLIFKIFRKRRRN